MAAVVGATLGLTVITSCTAEPSDRGGTLPPLTPAETAATSASSASTGSSAAEAASVRTTYLGFLRSYVRAQHVPIRQRRAYLERWLAEPRLTETVRSLAYDDKHYLRTVGVERPHVYEVAVQGARARVYDCLDRTPLHVIDSRTGKIISGSRGPGHFWIVARLTYTRAGWRVFQVTHQARHCTYDSDRRPPPSSTVRR